MSDDKRIGRQFPTQYVVLEYNDTKGGEAILLYEQSTRRNPMAFFVQVQCSH